MIWNMVDQGIATGTTDVLSNSISLAALNTARTTDISFHS